MDFKQQQLKRSSTSSMDQSHTSAYEENLAFSHPHFSTNMQYQFNIPTHTGVYTLQDDYISLSGPNDYQTKNPVMTSDCYHQEGPRNTQNSENGLFAQRELAMWLKCWKLEHTNTTAHMRAAPGENKPITNVNRYQHDTTHGAPFPQSTSFPFIRKQQPSPETSRKSWQPAPTCDGIHPNFNNNFHPSGQWTESGVDVVDLSSTMGEIPRSSVNDVSPNITGWIERNDLRYYPNDIQKIDYLGTNCLESQPNSWTDISYSDIADITTRYQDLQWETGDEVQNPDYGYYCSPGSPFSLALSSAATPELALATANPEPLLTEGSNTFFEDPDVDNLSEGRSRESSSTGGDTDDQFTPREKADDCHVKKKGCRASSLRNDERDAFLIECKLSGMSYKEIKAKGKFTVAESTLRGRFRSLTKRKELRVRKPGWQDRDVRLLCEAVKKFAEPLSVVATDDGRLPSKISWKQVGEYIWKKGGSYHFGNATCKKKWAELQRNQSFTHTVLN